MANPPPAHMPPWEQLLRLQKLVAFISTDIELGRHNLIKVATTGDQNGITRQILHNQSLQRRRHIVANLIDQTLIQASLPLTAIVKMPDPTPEPLPTYHPLPTVLDAPRPLPLLPIWGGENNFLT